MANLSLSYTGNMDITNASISGESLNVTYGENTTGRITGFTYSPDPSETVFICGNTYTIRAYPSYSGSVLSESFTVSGYDTGGNQRSDTSVLNQAYDRDLRHYYVNTHTNASVIINSSALTENYYEVNFTLTNGGIMNNYFLIFGLFYRTNVNVLIQGNYINLIPMTVTYNVTSTTTPTQILSSSGATYFLNATLDNGAEIPLETGYTFSETGNQTVHYTLTSTTIEDACFSGCTRLVGIDIPSEVTSIGANVFRGCTGLSAITIPDTVLSIGEYAFSNCSSLSSVTLPSGLTRLNSYCFYRCTSLTGVTIPNSVTSIDDYCFYYCTSLTGITIPESVTSIGNGCFQACTSLESITIPDSVTSIGYRCFYSDTSLTDVSLGSGLISIGDRCFLYCTSLTSITIPESVTSIGGNCFGYCSGLTEMTFESETPPTLSGASNSLGSTSYTFPIYVPCNAITTYRAAYTYYAPRITCPEIGDITSITLNVSSEITNSGGATVTISPELAYSNIVYSSSDTSIATIDSDGNITVVSGGTVQICATDTKSGLSDCKTITCSLAITAITLNVAEYVYSGEFASASYSPSNYPANIVFSSSDPTIASIDSETGEITTHKLDTVTICATDTYTGLYDCKDVFVSISPDELVEVVYNVTSTESPTLLFSEDEQCGIFTDFADCYIYDGVLYDESEKYLTFNQTGEQSILVKFKSFEGQDGNPVMGNSIFKDNPNIIRVTFPENYAIVETGNYTFYGCTNLSAVTMPSFVQLNYASFYGCTGLRNVSIPNVVVIGENAFSNTGLQSINGPSVTTLEPKALAGTPNLNNPTFPVLETMGGWAYSGSSLQDITLPSSLTTIDNGIFSECSELRNVTFESTTPPSGIEVSTFSGVFALTNIWVPCDSKTAYRNWLPSDTDSIPLNGHSLRYIVRCEDYTSGVITATYNLTGGTSTLIVNKVTDDGTWGSLYIEYAYATAGTASIVGIEDSSGNTVMFYPGNNLTVSGVTGEYTLHITVDLDVANEIGFGPMFCETLLKSVTLPSGINQLGNLMFGRCRQLTGITIPSSVTTINTLCFLKCTSLGVIYAYPTSQPSLTIFTRTMSTSFTCTPFCEMEENGTLYYKSGSSYSTWLKSQSGKPYSYLGTLGWTGSATL